MLWIGADEEYVEKELETLAVLERGLRLVYPRCLGRVKDLPSDSVHIDYTELDGQLELSA